MAQYQPKMLASLTIGAREWVWPAVVIFAAGAALAFWGYARVNANRSTRMAGLALRIIDEAKVGFAPGGTFGPGGEGFLRMCYLRDPDKLSEALQRFTDWLRKQRR